MTPVGMVRLRRGFVTKVALLYVVLTVLAIAIPALAANRVAPAGHRSQQTAEAR